MIRWITERLGTASYYALDPGALPDDTALLDVRELVDKEGNTSESLARFVERGTAELASHTRLVVCCDMGISRSNAIAYGILLRSGEADPDRGLELLKAALGSVDIHPALFRQVRELCASPPDTQEADTHEKADAGVLVTGASGYLGRAVVEQLSAEHDVVPLDRARFDLSSDLLDLDTLVAERGITRVLHLAHPRKRANVAALGESLVMLKTLLELCRLNGLSLFYVSGLNVFSGYGGSETRVAHPDLAGRPRGTYAESKYLCESLIREHRERGLRATILRPAAIYGPGMHASSFITKFFDAAEAGATIRTHRYRNGPPSFDFLWLDDAVSAIAAALRLAPKVPVSFGTGVATSTGEVARSIVRLVGSDSTVETLDIDDEVAHVIADSGAGRLLGGWAPHVDLETGLERIARERQLQLRR